MSKFNHTPGPWKNNYGLIVNESQAAPVICSMFGKDEHDFHNSPANSRLITAAPGMLDALIEYMAWGAKTRSDLDLLENNFRRVIESATSLPIEEVLK